MGHPHCIIRSVNEVLIHSLLCSASAFDLLTASCILSFGHFSFNGLLQCRHISHATPVFFLNHCFLVPTSYLLIIIFQHPVRKKKTNLFTDSLHHPVHLICSAHLDSFKYMYAMYNLAVHVQPKISLTAIFFFFLFL